MTDMTPFLAPGTGAPSPEIVRVTIVQGEAKASTDPRTEDRLAALRQVPNLLGAFFSILDPGKSIPAHDGPYTGYLRYHLALKVPAQGRVPLREPRRPLAKLGHDSKFIRLHHLPSRQWSWSNKSPDGLTLRPKSRFACCIARHAQRSSTIESHSISRAR